MDKRNKDLLSIYRSMYTSKISDDIEAELVNSGEANFLASSRGHEGAAIINPYLKQKDWLCCHYRDKALMLARGVSNESFFYSAMCKDQSHSHGRQMVSHMSAPELNITSIVAPVGNNALHAAGIAHTVKDDSENPVVLCSMGDGTTQQGEVYEGLTEASRNKLPVLFFIHNNFLAISTKTQGQTFFALGQGIFPKGFLDIPITRIDGKQPLKAYEQIGKIINNMREKQTPHIIVFNVDRLSNHSNADNQSLYRGDIELSTAETRNDPVKNARQYLLDQGIIKEKQLTELEKQLKDQAYQAVDKARQGDDPEAVYYAARPLPEHLRSKANEYRGDENSDERLSMLQAMRGVFHHRLANDSSVCLLGEDIEDKKGDVFGVTKGLSTRFKGRVVNSALSESTIVGVCAGMALAGKHPVAFIQFADFMPLAFNQIANELATMYWRTAGSWETPVIIFAPCGGYKPGLGPFHSMTNEAIYTHIPGVDVYMPSNAGDAAGLLNAAFESKRPSIFLYPKKLLNNTGMADTTSPDIHRHLVPPATARILNVGSDITLLTWGNGIEICIDVASTLEQENISVEIMDLRTMHPYDLDTILKSVEKTEKMLIVHEDNQSCGVGAEISAAVNENAMIPVTVRRATRADTYTPCNFANQLEVLPSYERVLENVCDMLDIDVEWINKGGDDASLYEVEVLGASPSDESVTILDLHVSEGDQIKASAIVAETETSKSTSEILSPLSGTVEKMHYNEGDQATVGESLLSLRLPAGTSIPPGLKRQQKKPVLTPKDPGFCKVDVDTGALPFKVHRVGISVPVFKTGSKLVTNEDLVENFPGRTAEEIRELMGVDQRWWLDEGESIVNIAANTAHEMLEKEGLTLQDIDSIVCATCTPDEFVSPSIACLVLYQLYQIYGEHAVQAVDLNAACSGYLYALQHANNYLKTRPYGKVLVITAEALSKRLDKHDFNTAFLFADAASSTIVYGESYLSKAKAMINKVSLAATAEDGAILNIPTEKKSEEEGITLQNGITLKGQKLFTYAVKHMSMILKKCLERTQWSIDELDLVIPHQANQRISHAIEKRLGMKKGSMYSNIAKYGNTSSCTIPIGMAEMMHDTQKDNKIALAAFGSGFTYGAITLSVIH